MAFAAGIELAAFGFGLLLGSFLNVCISRLPTHRSLAKPRSHCPQCLQTIRWYDNIPLLSWLLLAGRCRHCKESIPWRYPAIELAFAGWTMWCSNQMMAVYALRAGELSRGYLANHPAAGMLATRATSLGLLSEGLVNACLLMSALLALGFLLLGLMVMDWQTHTLPDAFTLTGVVLGFALVCVRAIFLPTGAEDVHFNPQSRMRLNSPGSFAARGDVFLTGPEHLVFGRLAAIFGAALLPLLVSWLYRALRKREGMGLGDVKLMAMVAALLGFWPAMFALFAGVLLCAGYALILLARRRADLATQLPLGSFLAAGGLLSAVAGEPLMAWYRGLL